MLDDRITLIRRAAAADETTVTETWRKCFAKAQLPTRTEFYKALQTGLKIQVTFTVPRVEYDGETLIEWKGKRYTVERSWPTDRTFMQLVCSETV